ncbi:ATP-dependent rRNA helicase RRP3 [Coprinopsis cinerea AmutBmut pab1-1]|nr:ATP-dependent rRNA helicase RRP3 [Coprinopsis cinerea AmutBmut pab1-1]
MPFFPGSKQGDGDDTSDLGYHGQHGLDRQTVSSVSASSLDDYRSARSSPSPSQQSHETPNEPIPVGQPTQLSPTFRQVDASKPYPVVEARNVRDGSMFGVMGTLPEDEDVSSFSAPEAKPGGLQSQASFSSPSQEPHNQSPPVTIASGPSIWGTGSFKSTSPVSSLDSASQILSNFDGQSLEAQLKASPFLTDLLERLVRCEASTRQIQSDLSTVHRKVNLLVERALAGAAVQPQPEFQDPFSTNPIPPVTNGRASLVPQAPLAHRPSIGAIAPNQLPPVDEMTQITNQLNALTTSVSHLLALQTGSVPYKGFESGRNSRNSTPGLNMPAEIPPHQVLSQSASGSTFLGHGLPNNRPDLRPSPRQPNPPMRTWSAGTLDLPIRNSEPSVARPELGGKRRSVVGLRRDSSGVLDGERDGPGVTKWEQLPLAPDLLRSLTKYGIGPPNKIQQRALPFLLRGSDIIAQAPPTQERIAAYVIPAIQVAVTHLHVQNRGPFVIMVSTTVDQATQAQRMIRDIGGPIGVRSALGVGTTNATTDLTQECRLLQQNMPHIICGTPQKLHALFTTPGGLQGSDVRFLVLDEVDQLIARNLHEFVFNIVKLLPSPRSRPPGLTSGAATPTNGSTLTQPGFTSPFEAQLNGRRPSFVPSPAPAEVGPIERQTALFSNTVPQDVLNLAAAINLREPVRVLVRRDGNVSSTEPTQGSRGLRQFYLYLAFTASGRSDTTGTTSSGGLGIIGSGRGATNAETVQAREWKLDALGDLFEDMDISQAIVHVGGMASLDSVVYKLASRGFEAIPLHGEMNAGTKLAALNKFRLATSMIVSRPVIKILVVYDVQVKIPEVPHVPLVINYDLPKAVEEYAHRVVPAISPNHARAGVVVNFVTATGGDVEMLRSIECHYKIKCPEVPMNLREIL